MTGSAELRMWSRLDALNAERAKILRATAPFEEEKADLQRGAERLRLQIDALETRIQSISFPHLRDLMAEISLLSKALSGKARPTDAE